jgi:hypothetical protein
MDQFLTPIIDLENNIVVDDNSVLEITTSDCCVLEPDTFSLPEDTSFVDLENCMDPYLVEPNTEVITPSTNIIPNANPKNVSNQEVHASMSDIEQTVNFSSADELAEALTTGDILINIIQNAFDTFKEKTGRSMTYNEMRHMMG